MTQSSSKASPRLVKSAAALLIGDELLSGKIEERNLQPLARCLRQLGIPLERVALVADKQADIVEELNRARERSDLVITCGGLGPTHDDITVDAVAAAFGVPVCTDPTLESLLREYFKDRLTPEHLRMARIPEGCELLINTDNPWPSYHLDGVWLLPGIPELFRSKLGVLREHLRGPAVLHSVAVLSPIEEGELTELIDLTVARFTDVAIGSYPRLFDSQVKTKITFDSPDRQRLEAAVTYLLANVPHESQHTRTPPSEPRKE